MSHLVLSGTLLGIEEFPFRFEVDLLRRLPPSRLSVSPDLPFERALIAFVPPYNNRDIPFPKKGSSSTLHLQDSKKWGCFRSSHRHGNFGRHEQDSPNNHAMMHYSLENSRYLEESVLYKGVLAFAIMAQKWASNESLFHRKMHKKHPLYPTLRGFSRANPSRGHRAMHTKRVGIPRTRNLYKKSKPTGSPRCSRSASMQKSIEIAAAGGHNLLMMGSPGCGKTMMALRLPSILPSPSFEESLEITLIHSACGNNKERGLHSNTSLSCSTSLHQHIWNDWKCTAFTRRSISCTQWGFIFG